MCEPKNALSFLSLFLFFFLSFLFLQAPGVLFDLCGGLEKGGQVLVQPRVFAHACPSDVAGTQRAWPRAIRWKKTVAIRALQRAGAGIQVLLQSQPPRDTDL
jgi:hypothetical protein